MAEEEKMKGEGGLRLVHSAEAEKSAKAAATERVIFLDFDGVIRVLMDDRHGLGVDRAEFCPERMERLRRCCELLEAAVVVSSDWRTFAPMDIDEDSGIIASVGSNRPEVEGHLGRLAGWLHDDWATPVKGARWREVADWLARHPEVAEYAILEDHRQHFKGCPAEMAGRIVWCNNRHGFVAELSGRLCQLFAPGDGSC